MFTEIIHLRAFSQEQSEKYKNRWNGSGKEGKNESHERVVALIKEKAGKHFLNSDFYKGNLPAIDDDLDLRGFFWWKLETDFEGGGDNFRGINFSYAEFYHDEIKNAAFSGGHLNFSKFYNVKFKNCLFFYTQSIGATFEKCIFEDCEFLDANNFNNVKFESCNFKKCYLGEVSPFEDCYFDANTKFEEISFNSSFRRSASTKREAISSIYNSIKLGYEAADAIELADEYFLRAKKSFAKYNAKGREKVVLNIIDFLTGYGVQPIKPILNMILVYVLGVLYFSIYMPVNESLIFVAGGLFTFGAKAEYLNEFNVIHRLVYVLLSFLGISLSGLFIATLSTVFFRNKVSNRAVKRY